MAKNYTQRIYAALGIAPPSWAPEFRWPTSGVESFVASPDIRSGALDRMYSGVQKESPWNMGVGSQNTFRFTGVYSDGVTTPTVNPDMSFAVPYRTQRALQDSGQGQYSYPNGPAITDGYYAATYAAAQQNQVGIASRILRSLGRLS